jgi:arsenate reductase
LFKLYGIKNCNTVKKAIDWMNIANISFEFMDVKKNSLNIDILNDWVQNLPENHSWESLVNKSGITWRKLDDVQKESAANLKGALALILEKPSVMKRPVIADGKKIFTIGFNETIFEEKFL